MPCYLFTYHGHATWMPDHRRGYVHRTRGLQPRDDDMAARYRNRQRSPAVVFRPELRELLVKVARQTGPFLDATVHACGAEQTHLHVLVSWEHARTWKSMRTSIRSALSRRLNEQFGKRDWFSDSPSRKRVKDHDHFDYLVLSYLPGHATSWVREQERDAAMKRDARREVSVFERAKRKKH